MTNDENRIDKMVKGEDKDFNEILAKAGMFKNVDDFKKSFFNKETLKF